MEHHPRRALHRYAAPHGRGGLRHARGRAARGRYRGEQRIDVRTLGLSLRWLMLIGLVGRMVAAWARPEVADAPPGSPTTAPTHPVGTRASLDTTRLTGTPA